MSSEQLRFILSTPFREGTPLGTSEFRAGKDRFSQHFVIKMPQLRQIGLVALLLCALSHAWFGHDLFHGHHHDELHEASYSTSWKGQADQLTSLLGSPALLTPTQDWAHLQTSGDWIDTIEESSPSFQAPHFLDAQQVPRPPPSFSFIA